MAERRALGGENTRGRWSRHEDMPDTWPAFFAWLGKKYGLPGILVVALLYVLLGDIKGTEQKTYEVLREHSRDASAIMQQQCISLAILAGQRTELCTPPSQRDH